MKVVLLAGGFGGARMAKALAEAGIDLTVIANVGDDEEILSLHVSPDIDSIIYALAGIDDEERGWGRKDETWNALEAVEALGGETWFQLGDRDLAMHLVRTRALRAFVPLSRVTASITEKLGIGATVLPATDDRLRTMIETRAGTFPFQEWYVGRGHRDEATGVRYEGAAEPAPGVVEALEAARLIVIAPSNPYLSVGPILAIEQIRKALVDRSAPAVAVSPLIGGQTVKGPAAQMLERFAGGTSAAHVAARYEGFVDALVLDEQDAHQAGAVEELGVRPIVAATLMQDERARAGLAHAVLEAAAVPR